MKFSLAWLDEWIALPPLDELEDRLTVGGLEIEGIEQVGVDLKSFVVGQVLERTQHPNADRLSVCKVDIGSESPLEIVCGAPNVQAEQKVVVALHGSVLPDGTKIKRSKLRGITSNGMICSERELGLGVDHSGILILPKSTEVGVTAAEVIGDSDKVLDISITPNRGDWLSILGMAREVRAHFGGTIRLPEIQLIEEKDKASDRVSVEILDEKGCQKYLGRVVRDVTVGSSPKWLSSRVESAGIRSINNVVDITNYVMMELGQPLHAFDLRKITGTVSVRRAFSNEEIEALNDKKYVLTEDDLVIADDDKALAIAGVIGSVNSEVEVGTKEVFLEAAIFHPSQVRKTARRLGLSTEASYRFERGVDTEGLEFAIDRAACLIKELAGGGILSGPICVRGESGSRVSQVTVAVERVNKVLGTDLIPETMMEVLGRLDLVCTLQSDVLVCEVPPYRSDLRIEEDLIEEIARVYGYDQIPETLPAAPGTGISVPPLRTTIEEVRDTLCSVGLVELMTFSSARAEDKKGLRQDGDSTELVEISNPIRADEPFLRHSLVPSVLRMVRQNLSRQAGRVSVFEISRVFRQENLGELPFESSEAVAVIAGIADKDLWTQEAPLFFQIKGIAERVFERLAISATFNGQDGDSYLHPGASGSYEVKGKRVASLGELHPATASHFEIDTPLAMASFDVSELALVLGRQQLIKDVSRFPSIRRDFSVMLNVEQESGEVIEAVQRAGGTVLCGLEVFDCYEGKGVPEGKKSLSLRLTFQRLDRTLRDEEVNKVTQRVLKMLEKRYDGILR